MKLHRTLHIHPAFFPLVPLINVLFLVLMLFAMSSRFVLQPGVSVTLPFSAFALEPQQNPQIVSVVAAPDPAIFFRNRKVTLAELEEQLGKVRSSESTRSLIIRADRNTPYHLIVQVMNRGLKHGFSVVLAAAPERAQDSSS